jgi:hypothetical protein
MQTADDLDIEDSEKAAVTKWLQEIQSAKDHWDKDFKRMRKCMQFVSGLQWPGQEDLAGDKYVANICLQEVESKVASLYAKNPKVTFQTRDRLNYQLWDGRLETLAVSIMQASGMGNMESKAVILDYLNGNRIKELLEKVGKTLEILYQYYCDSLQPDFKKQMKQMVRRTIITGVGYVKMTFLRDVHGEDALQTSEGKATLVQRVKLLQSLIQQLSEGDIDETSPKMQQIKTLMEGINSQQTQAYAQTDLGERLNFDFPRSTSLIPDKNCTCLPGFVGADWVAEEHCITIDRLNAFFGTNISVSQLDGFISGESGEYVELKSFNINNASGMPTNPKVCVYEVYDKITKTSFYVCKGWPAFLKEPELVEPCTKNFYPWFPLTFNTVEADDEAKVSPFPPSDVELMRHPQMAINSARHELERHRKAKRPRTMVPKGTFTENDKTSLQTAPSNAIIEIESAAALGDLTKVCQPFPTVPIDPPVYDTSPQFTDVLMTTGQTQGDFGIQQGHKKGETATAASIAEQSKQSKSQSNVDDLDGLLSDLAENGGELLLHEVTPQTVLRVAGPGAVWPLANRQDYINYIYLEAQAASSGRPNQALDVAKFKELVPLMQAAGVNPNWVVREAIRIYDSRIDPAEAFPLVPPQNVRPADPYGQPPAPMGQDGKPQQQSNGQQQQQPSNQQPQQPTQTQGPRLTNGSPLPAMVQRN